MRLRLYHDWDSFQSLKVRICLAEKGLAWTDARVALATFQNLQPDYLSLNPDGLVPTLVVDDQVLTESSIINELIEDAVPQPALRPLDPMQRAIMRRWVKFQDDVVHPAVRIPTFNLLIKQRVRLMPAEAFEAIMRGHPLPARAAAYRAAATSAIDIDAVLNALRVFKEILARIEHGLSHGPWLAGAEFSLADVALATFVNRTDRLAMASLWDSYPRASDWRSRIYARESFQRSIAPPGLGMPEPDRALVAQLLDRAA